MPDRQIGRRAIVGGLAGAALTGPLVAQTPRQLERRAELEQALVALDSRLVAAGMPPPSSQIWRHYQYPLSASGDAMVAGMQGFAWASQAATIVEYYPGAWGGMLEQRFGPLATARAVLWRVAGDMGDTNAYSKALALCDPTLHPAVWATIQHSLGRLTVLTLVRQ